MKQWALMIRTKTTIELLATLAQLVERLICNLEVVGSSPTGGFGEVMNSRRHAAGKGDKYRQVDTEKYRENYEKIFGKKKKKKTPKGKDKK